MKKLSVLAFACVLVCDTVSPVTTYAQLTDLTSAANRQTARAISKLLQKYPRGGDEMVLATERLVEINAASTTAIVAAASNMNSEQKAAVEQGIARAVGLLGKCDTDGHCGSQAAQQIQDYLDKNKSDPIVAAILVEEVALGSIGDQGAGGGLGAGVSPVAGYGQLADSASVSSRQTARAISALLHRYPRGGHEMVLATERLVENSPASTPAIVTAASSMNPEQKAAVEQAIAQAVGLLGKCDTNGHCGSEAAQEIQDYLDNNKSDPIVAAILIEEVALGSIGNQGSGGGSGAGGGGFSGGAGPAISPS